MEEFDEKEVLDLIEKALAIDGSKALQPERILPLAFNEGKLLEVLATKLTSYLPIPDVQVVLDDLRDELYSGINQGDIKTLHAIAKNCRRCPLMTPAPTMPQWNLTDPDVIFVAEAPTNQKEAIDLLIGALRNSGFKSQRVMLTYVNRCTPKERRRASAEEITTCSTYLHSEIQILRPKLVVALGAIPTATILGADVKISEERGKICWLGPWAILPTFSPAYVIKGAAHLAQSFEQDVQRAYGFTYGER
jgi:uracil-DNA glycosylase family 4